MQTLVHQSVYQNCWQPNLNANSIRAAQQTFAGIFPVRVCTSLLSFGDNGISIHWEMTSCRELAWYDSASRRSPYMSARTKTVGCLATNLVRHFNASEWVDTEGLGTGEVGYVQYVRLGEWALFFPITLLPFVRVHWHGRPQLRGFRCNIYVEVFFDLPS